MLGAHPHEGGVTIRALKPLAESVVVRHGDGTAYPLEHVHEGVWVGEVPGTEIPDYRLEVTYGDGPPTPSTTRTGSCPRSARWTCT